jgi:hypothetical protein
MPPTGENDRAQREQACSADTADEPASDELREIASGACDDVPEDEHPYFAGQHAFGAEHVLIITKPW